MHMRKITMKQWRVVCAVFFLSACLILTAFALAEKVEYDQNRLEVERFAKNIAGRLELSSLEYTGKARILADLVLLNPQDIQWFPAVAAALKEDPMVLSIQLFKGGQLQMSYPQAESLLLPDNDRLMDVLYGTNDTAASAGEALLYGPIQLKDGEKAVAGVQPIYIYDSVQGFRPWGAAMVLLRVPSASMLSNFTRLETEGYAYSLWSLNSEEQELLLSSASPVGSSPVREVIHVPNGSWVLAMEPESGWFNEGRILIEVIVGLLTALVLSFFTLLYFHMRRQRECMRLQALTDPLTRLGNRRVLMDHLEAYCRRPELHFLLCYMDLNDFKKVNDQYGHDIGDRLIQESAVRIAACLKPSDQFFRIGGDEFIAILQPEQEEESWRSRTDFIAASLQKEFLFNGHCIRISVSIGCAVYPQTARTPDGLLRAADMRMFNDKERNYLEGIEANDNEKEE